MSPEAEQAVAEGRGYDIFAGWVQQQIDAGLGQKTIETLAIGIVQVSVGQLVGVGPFVPHHAIGQVLHIQTVQAAIIHAICSGDHARLDELKEEMNRSDFGTSQGLRSRLMLAKAENELAAQREAAKKEGSHVPVN